MADRDLPEHELRSRGPVPGRPAARPLIRSATLVLLVAGSVEAGPLSAERAATLVGAAMEQTRSPVRYDGAYRRIAYPGGDVPADVGVCTDVVIRAYRALGIDLQVAVHEDMERAFASYPRIWGRSAPDTNIDHRRVPNLRTFFARAGAALPVSRSSDAYEAGDLVTWTLPGNLPHIGIVARERSAAGVPLVIHNIGRGPQLEDSLFAFPVTGHYRYDH